MATTLVGGVLRHLRRVALARDGAGLTDGELLECFIAGRDEAAFQALALRHGPMVLGVCRRVLRHEADAEDAFQATFLILVKKAATIVPRSMVGNWLYGVAHNTALKAKAMNGKRRVKEKLAWRGCAAAMPVATRRLHDLLDDELSRLPDKYRVPIVLCDLEGKPIKEAARQLGWPQGTVASRLARARGMLAKRMASHGLAFSGGALAALVTVTTATAAVPVALMESTMRAATCVAAGGTAATATSAAVAVLFERMMRTMMMRHLHTAVGLTLIAAFGIGLSVCLCQAQAQVQQPGTAVPSSGQQSEKPAPTDVANAGRLYFHLDLGLATVQPDGKETKHLPSISQNDILGGYQSHSARLSPDGKRLAFGKAVTRNIDGGTGVFPPDKIYVRDMAKDGDGEVVAELADAELHHWCWSPDGTRLAIASWDAANHARNWVVDLKTKKLNEVKLPRFKVKDEEYSMAIQAWSPDGGWFLASGDGLHLVKTDGTGAKRLTAKGTNLMSGTCRFSPDGRKVLFVVVAHKPSMKLYVADVPGGKTRAVVDVMNFTDMHASWSPDSRRIAYSVTLLDGDGERSGETSLFVTDADGNNTVTVRTEKHDPRQIRLRLTDWR
jgi:RNA polymerase sigma factor (sigma-70 family)